MSESSQKRIHCTYLIIGSGLAGLTAALEAAKHGKVIVITKTKAEECNTRYAQGGIACVVDKNDTFEAHISDTLTAGDRITCFDTPFGRVGVCVCYDVRFFEIFRLMQKAGCGIIAIPACFTNTTGKAHWEILFRSRAIDIQCYMLGCAQTRVEDAPFVCYSHSIVCDPWGRVLGDAGTEEGILYADLDLDRLQKTRRQLPLAEQLREDVYKK